ncbi:MAG TPA: SMP-30/gluconolactonase/LRE family protein [Casimicrobiaceae bacterium]|nr:SMP-30/gluconolactonase/LRE family protein [Casimicrobiaceae bacterium]
MRRAIGALIVALTALACCSSESVFAAALAYIPNAEQAGVVTVLDTDTNVVAAVIPAGNVPVGIAIAPDGTRIYVSNLYQERGYGVGTVSVISAQPAALLATVPVGNQSTGIAVTPNGRFVYVANSSDNTVSVIEAATLTVMATIAVGSQPEGVVASPDGGRVYVAAYRNVYVISTGTNVVAKKIPTSDFANGVALSRDGRRLYVANINTDVLDGRGSVSVISTETDTVMATIAVGVHPNGVAISPDAARVYVANSSDSTVSVIDTAVNAVSATVRVGNFPFGVSVTPDGSRVYVANNGESTVSVVDTRSNQVVETIHIANGVIAFGNFIGPELSPQTSPVVEFHNAALDHYFITQAADEIAGLDGSVHPGWARTGQTFLAWLPGRSSGNAKPVCRYYGLPSAGLDSHFYSASVAECVAVAERFGSAWTKEADDVFEIGLPDATSGACSDGATPVYRLWNGRADSNHRYTTDAASRQHMIDLGWVPEGYGPLGVVMCAPH